MTDFADQYYSTLHGSNEGLDKLKDQVKQSPLPPAGFKIKTATEVADEKQAEFEKTNPKLALWMKIKGALVFTPSFQPGNGKCDVDSTTAGRTIVNGRPERAAICSPIAFV